MKKKLAIISLSFVVICLLASCGCKHDWREASCFAPKMCMNCYETEGTALSHDWLDATCTSPKTCNRCNISEGEKTDHVHGEWVVAEEPTQTTAGIKNQLCETCTEVLDSQYEYFYEITPNEEVLYNNVLDAYNSVKSCHAAPESFTLLGAVSTVSEDRVVIYVSYTTPDGQTDSEYFWKDTDRSVVKSVYAKDNYFGSPESVFSLNLEELFYFENCGAYSQTKCDVYVS